MSDLTKEIFVSKRNGYTKYPWYSSYYSMMIRCYRKTSYNYYLYGARGIRVCEEWHDIEYFKKWVDKSDYVPGLSIDRINVNEDYKPDNCRWVDSKTQANNRRNNVYITHNGETHTIAEWSDITGIDRTTLGRRYRNGCKESDVFFTGRFHNHSNPIVKGAVKDE